MISDVDPTDE